MNPLKHILELLDATAAHFGERRAYCDEHTTRTWAEVQNEVQRIGTALAQKKVQYHSVALYLEHESPCILAMLGTLAAGGFYTVLDTAQPADRVRRITDQLSPVLLLTDEAHKDTAAALNTGAEILTIEQALSTEPDLKLLAALRAAAVDTDLAYVLFTSGSTGLPKGVAIQHRAVLAYSQWAAQTFNITEKTIFGNQTPFYFSMSVTDIFASLRTGASVQVIPKRLFSFPVQLLDYMSKYSVNTIYWVPSAMGIVANWKAIDYVAPPALHTILFAGEVMPNVKLNYWRAKYPDALFANLYGPTETTDICAYYVVNRPFADDEPLPIGNACDNCGLVILKDGRAAAPDEEGELCARGSFLAAGYYGMPEKTAERFIQNPLQPNYPEILYRTGDLVTVNEYGELMFSGRIDHQIKHMGYRIELGEIETAAYGQDKLESCACLFDEPKDRLVLFFQAKKDVTEQLRQRLTERLPNYMRPAAYVRVRNMPQNQNGKIDRGELKKLLPEG